MLERTDESRSVHSPCDGSIIPSIDDIEGNHHDPYLYGLPACSSPGIIPP